MWSRRAHHALFRHKSLVFRYFLMFPDVSISGIFSTSPRSHVVLVYSSDSFAFPSFLPLKLLPYFRFTPRAFTQLPVNHSRKNVVRFVSFSRVSTVRLSGKFRTVIAVPATLEPAASPPFPFFPALPSNAILVVDPTQIDDRLCRLAIVHRPTINPHG